MRRVGRAAAAALAVAAAGLCAAAVERLAPYRQVRAAGGWVDWLEGEAGSVGWTRSLGRRIESNSPRQRQARQESLSEARRRLLDSMEPTPLGEAGLLGDRPDLMELVRAALETAPIDSVEMVRGERMQATIRARLWGDGGLFAALLDRLAPRGESASAAQAAPRPDGDPEAGAAAPPDAAGMASKAGTPAEVSGLLVDAAAVESASPALLPRLLDPEGRVVYEAGMADPQALRTRGPAGYGVRLEFGPPRRPGSRREGARPLEVKAVAAAGPHGTDLVVTAEDAERIAAAAAATPILRECRILILLPPPRAELPAPAPRRPATPRQPAQPPPPAEPE